MAPFLNRVYGGGATVPIPVDSLVPKSFAEFFVGFSAKDRKNMDLPQLYLGYLDKFSVGLAAFEGESVRSLEKLRVEREIVELGRPLSPAPSVASSARSSGVRLAGIRRIASWRSGSSSVGSLAPVHSVVQERGYCYLSLVKPQFRPSLGEKLGSWPALSQVLALPASSVALSEFDTLKVSSQPGDVCHVAQSTEGRSLGPVLSAVASTLPSVPGTLSEAVRRFLPDNMHSFSSATRAGGKNEIASTLQGHLAVVLGVSESAFSSVAIQDDLRLVVRSIGMLSGRDKDRFRLLELLGDSAVTHSLVARVAAERGSAQDAQERRAARTSNVSLSAVFVRSFDLSWFSYPAGVNPATGNVGAKFLEAVVGLVDTHFGVDKVETLIAHLQLWD